MTALSNIYYEIKFRSSNNNEEFYKVHIHRFFYTKIKGFASSLIFNQ